MRPLLAVIAAFLVLATSCSDSDEPSTTPTPEPSPTEVATPSPEPSPTIPGIIQVPSRALLLEVSTGKVTTLYESMTDLAWEGRWDGEVAEISVPGGVRRFNLDGTPATPPPTSQVCTFPQGGIEIGGRKFPDVPRCGAFSPDGRWMMFERPAGEVELPNGARVPSSDQWVLDIATGATRELQKGLVHCGGCDGRYGPRWSPSSQYVAYAESGGTARRFLSGVTTGQTRVIGAGNDLGFAPHWAPNEDRIVYSTAQTVGAGAILEDLHAGTTADLPIQWPAAFDASGHYLYSPAWGEGPKAMGQTTTVIDARTFSRIATLAGAPPQWVVWRGPAHATVAQGTSGLVAALQGATGCEGTSITVGLVAARCVDAGAAGASNPQATWVAVARIVGTTGPARGPGLETVSLSRYSIELFDLATGQTRAGIGGVLNWDYQAPVMLWNEAGTHLLVLAPSATGL